MTAGELFTGLGYLTGLAVFVWASRGFGLRLLPLAIVGLSVGLIGAKVFEALSAGRPSAALDPASGGRAILPGILIGWLAVEVAKKAWGIRGATGGAFALALAAGEGVGRIGCFLNPCCVGSPTDVPWAVYQAGAWRHPSQLYSSAAAFVILTVLLVVRSRWSEAPLFAIYLALWGATRFFLEFFRDRTLVFGLSTMQWLGIELAVSSGIALVVLARRRKMPLEAVP
ncbi:MAG: prolipoprotein diacylglyceryl transferase [Armatimonadetes bacterium]|nr:prolipoprotein diacylglyceryl transferase [Armatimonadota bacterium]